MQKIPTLFLRDENAPGRPVIDQVTAGCEWVLEGEGVPTFKLDGQNVKIQNGRLFRRQKPFDRPYDDGSYTECDRANPMDKYLWAAFDAVGAQPDGIYEAVGPKIQGNPHGLAMHGLVRVFPYNEYLEATAQEARPEVPRTFEGLRIYLTTSTYEGIVFHHTDGRMAKIKRRDYRLPWPIARG